MMIKSLHAKLESLSLNIIDFDTSFFMFNEQGEAEPMFAHLHTLALIRASPSLHVIASRHLPLDFSKLPPSLTVLNLNDKDVIRVSPTETPINTLPRLLKRLGATVSTNFTSAVTEPSDMDAILADWSKAPEDLEYIRNLQWTKDLPQHTWMPRNLRFGRFDHFCFPWTLQHALASVSPHLAELSLLPIDYDSFTSNSTSWAAMLPKNLQKLSIEAPTYAPIEQNALLPQAPITRTPLLISAGELAQMPKTIKNLFFEHASFDWGTFPSSGTDSNKMDVSEAENALQGIWPSQLERLAFILGASRPGLLSLLPRSLRSIDITYAPETTTIETSKFYAGELENFSKLQTLSIVSAVQTSLIEFEGLLPQSLTSLTLKTWMTSSGGLSKYSLEKLPDSITYLDVHISGTDCANPNSAKPLYKIPAKLDVLKVNIWYCGWFSVLPPALRHLSVADLNSVTIENGSEIDLFSTLPTSLTYLKLTGHIRGLKSPSTLTFSSYSFSTLPNLVDVHCAFSNGQFPSSVIRSLPKSLKSLSLRLEKLQADDAPFLPSCLQSLTLGAFVPWNLEYIRKHWPPMAYMSIPKREMETIEFVKGRVSELS